MGSGAAADLTDEALVMRLGRGDTSAFDALYARYSQRALGYLRRMLAGDEARAQDLLQDLFLTVIDKGHTIDPERQFSRWLFGVAHNLCCSEHRRGQVRRQAEAELSRARAAGPAGPDPGSRLDAERFVHRLHGELERLDPERRSAFLLRYGDGLAIDDIAAALGCPAGTVKSRLFYTVRLLADRLRPFAPLGDEGEPQPGAERSHENPE
ncbi:MAG: sigma-70 family RNA polymerase sigma factor [Gemmatimonadota bacterium]